MLMNGGKYEFMWLFVSTWIATSTTSLVGNQFATNLTDGDITTFSPTPSSSSTPEEEVVLIAYNRTLGAVCGDDWSMTEARVTCKELGFHHGQATSTSALNDINPSSWSFYLEDVQCNGDETKLIDCVHSSLQRNADCETRKAAGVTCFEAKVDQQYISFWDHNGDIRLEPGPNDKDEASFGTVQILKRGVGWAGVCSDGWTWTNADVVCMQLGFDGASSKTAPSVDVDANPWLILLDDVNCEGWESRLLDCHHSGFGNPNSVCESGKLAGVKCKIYGSEDHGFSYEWYYSVIILFVCGAVVYRFKHWRAARHADLTFRLQQQSASRSHSDPELIHTPPSAQADGEQVALPPVAGASLHPASLTPFTVSHSPVVSPKPPPYQNPAPQTGRSDFQEQSEMGRDGCDATDAAQGDNFTYSTTYHSPNDAHSQPIFTVPTIVASMPPANVTYLSGLPTTIPPPSSGVPSVNGVTAPTQYQPMSDLPPPPSYDEALNSSQS
ncbi:uncharacterized protein [Diadema setosum]|uniref:uncharacterized protein isoform X2 n=1 Tax=Diadema setosum TaxID=31175 RepID=UPI003B3BB927